MNLLVTIKISLFPINVKFYEKRTETRKNTFRKTHRRN